MTDTLVAEHKEWTIDSKMLSGTSGRAPSSDENCCFDEFRFVRNVNVRVLRERLGLTQEKFARRYRFPLRSVQEWEQGRKRPAPGTMTLLLAISRKPKALADALS